MRRTSSLRRRHLVRAALVAGALLVSARADAQTAGCSATRADMLGPFYVANAPERSTTGSGLAVEGVVKSARACTALPGAKLEWWSANARGDYDDGHRATQTTGPDGHFKYVTDMPGKYPGRPVHLHVKVTAAGHKPLVTQIYPKPNENSIAFDVVLEPR